MRAKERRSNRLSAISDRLSRNAWKNNNNNNNINESSSNIMDSPKAAEATEATSTSATPCSLASTGVNDATLQLINAWTQSIKVRD